MTRLSLDMSDLVGEKKTKERPSMEQINRDAAAAGFTTLHAPRPVDPPLNTISTEPRRRGRKRTTNRNTQFTVKLKSETNDAIYNMADELDCVVAEVIERAMAALEREIAASRKT